MGRVFDRANVNTTLMSANFLTKVDKASRRFFYHYNKQKKKMTVHWKGRCLPVDEIVCMVPVETKTSLNQPHYVLQGWAVSVSLEENSDKRIMAIIR